MSLLLLLSWQWNQAEGTENGAPLRSLAAGSQAELSCGEGAVFTRLPGGGALGLELVRS